METPPQPKSEMNAGRAEGGGVGAGPGWGRELKALATSQVEKARPESVTGNCGGSTQPGTPVPDS